MQMFCRCLSHCLFIDITLIVEASTVSGHQVLQMTGSGWSLFSLICGHEGLIIASCLQRKINILKITVSYLHMQQMGCKNSLKLQKIEVNRDLGFFLDAVLMKRTRGIWTKSTLILSCCKTDEFLCCCLSSVVS